MLLLGPPPLGLLLALPPHPLCVAAAARRRAHQPGLYVGKRLGGRTARAARAAHVLIHSLAPPARLRRVSYAGPPSYSRRSDGVYLDTLPQHIEEHMEKTVQLYRVRHAQHSRLPAH